MSTNSPKFIRELLRFLPVKPQFVLWGNIYDAFPADVADQSTTLRLNDFLTNELKQAGYGIVLLYEPLVGFTLLEGESDLCKKACGESVGKEKPMACTLQKAAQMIESLSASQEVHSVVLLNFASRLSDIAKNDIEEFFYRMFRLSHRASPRVIGEAATPRHNLVLWILDKENDIPAWFTMDNTRVKNLAVPKPDFEVRRVVIASLAKSLSGFDATAVDTREEITSLFIDSTNGLHTTEIASIVQLARKEDIPFSRIADAIRMYKLGIVENPWSKLDLKKIEQAETVLAQRVHGQPGAVRKTADIIKRAMFNLSGAQYSRHSQRPKGVLFFAGPTGVGKTELAKAITALVFGSETSYLRFDMSEFSHEHSDQRLVGAPPGYVGYDVGGELTNAVRQNPFSVILFDEIEKAHPKILDIFLQILDDGRLTSGRGETAYFSETLIIFTSNLGIYEVMQDGTKVQRVSPEMKFTDIQNTILSSIEDFFKYRINRPEILNRIGKNVVVFDFIRPEVAGQICERMVNLILEKLEDSYKIRLEFTPESTAKILELCCRDLTMGGRGVGNQLEEVFVNPLSRSLFAVNAASGDCFTVADIAQDAHSWNVVLRKS